jgi:hypothetical protein
VAGGNNQEMRRESERIKKKPFFSPKSHRLGK